MEPPTALPGTPSPPRDAALAMAEIGVLSLILVLALGGNILVLVALSPPRRGVRRGPGDPPVLPAPPLRRYLRHLSLADLAAAAGQVLPQLLWDLTDRFRGPDALCRLTKYLQGVAMFASAYVAVAMAWDRHRAITRPLGAASGRPLGGLRRGGQGERAGRGSLRGKGGRCAGCWGRGCGGEAGRAEGGCCEWGRGDDGDAGDGVQGHGDMGDTGDTQGGALGPTGCWRRGGGCWGLGGIGDTRGGERGPTGCWGWGHGDSGGEGAQGRRDTWDGTWEPAGGWGHGDSGDSVTATSPLCPPDPHVTPVSPTLHVTSVPPSPNGTLRSPSPCDTSAPPVPHVTPVPPTPNGTPMSHHVPLMSPSPNGTPVTLHVPLMSPSPNGTPVTLHVPLMSPSPPSSPQVPSRSLSQATVGGSGTTIGVSGATTEGSWATTEGSQDITGGFGATIGVSVATTRVAQATMGEAGTNTGGSGTTTGVSWATTEGSGTTMEAPQATTGGSGTTTRGSWATTGGSGTAMDAPQATTGGSGATAGWSQVVTGWAGSALGRAHSALARARRGWDALATAWALSLLFGLPQVGIFGQREVAPGESDCWATFAQPWGARAYVTWVALAVLVAPAALLGGLQLAVTRELGGARGGPGGLGRARAKSHRMAVVVLGVFVLCWTPFFCAQLWAVWDPRAPREGPAFTILMLLASLTSCTNPWISAAFSTSLARAMARVLCPHRHRRGHTR